MSEIFDLGIKRSPGRIMVSPAGIHLNLGSGRAPIESATNLDRPGWEAPLLPFRDNSVAEIHMYHFLEHLTPDMAIEQLQECERVLLPGGVMNIVVPHAMVPLAFQAPDHRSFWTEEGFQDTWYSSGYDSTYGRPWKSDIVWMMVGGVRWSNLCVLLQVAKWKNGVPYWTPWRRESD